MNGLVFKTILSDAIAKRPLENGNRIDNSVAMFECWVLCMAIVKWFCIDSDMHVENGIYAHANHAYMKL